MNWDKKLNITTYICRTPGGNKIDLKNSESLTRIPMSFFDWCMLDGIQEWCRELVNQDLCFYEYKSIIATNVGDKGDPVWTNPYVTNTMINILFVNEADATAAKLKFNL